MPVPPGTRYRVKTNPATGGKVRLAFHGNQVIEAKKLKKVRKDANLTSHPMTPRDLRDNEIHTQLSGMLRGVGENFT